MQHALDWNRTEFRDACTLEPELERVFYICHGCRRCSNLCDMCFMTNCPNVPPYFWNEDFPHLMLRAIASNLA